MTDGAGRRGCNVRSVCDAWVSLAVVALAVVTLGAGGCARRGAVPADARIATAEPPDATASSGVDSSARASDVAMEQAAGAHRMAAARCGTLGGDARRACREHADADLERARAATERTRTGTRQDDAAPR
jgi:hypothetical protein